MKRINLRMEEEKFLFLEKKAKKLGLSINEFINKVLDDELISENYFSMFIENKRTHNDLINVIKKQNELINELNIWHEIHANMLKEILGGEK